MPKNVVGVIFHPSHLKIIDELRAQEGLTRAAFVRRAVLLDVARQRVLPESVERERLVARAYGDLLDPPRPR